ncbi:putative lipoprotein [Marinomonas sp. MED121]|uniref:DUF2931 family protein n=1 Tax=Marinomonas sp. MED121 TaxID=314277 RepID=UPI000068FF77|nr:DUF2931 family protein [Marinomonas sp. MED121]EAQ66644.1 putative lipoprotein [Marinomonas sp. MED121]
MKKSIVILLSFVLVACTTSTPKEWRYRIGPTNDEIHNTGLGFFFEDKKLFQGYEVGSVSDFQKKSILKGKFKFFHVGKRSVKHGVPVGAFVEWVSFVSKKRYGIALDLPKNLPEMMMDTTSASNCQSLFVPKNLVFGLAPNGYVEVYLFNGCWDESVLVSRAFAKEVETEYDKSYALEEQYGINEFHNKNKEFLEKNEMPYWRFQLDQEPISTSYGVISLPPENAK